MQIDLHNYKEFFLLYADNELTQQQKKMVDAFMNQHPGLKADLDLLLRTILPADKAISFSEKSRLMKESAITTEELLTYLDGEAGAEASGKIRRELVKNNDLRQEMTLLEKAVVKPDANVVYPRKQALYRSVPVRKMEGWKVAVAASVLFLLSTWLFLYKNDDNTADQVAVIDTVMQHSPAQTHTVVPPAAVITHAGKNRDGDAALSTGGKKEKPAVLKIGRTQAEKRIAAPLQVPAVAVNDLPKPAVMETGRAPVEGVKQPAVNAEPHTEGNGDKPGGYKPVTVSTIPAPQQVAAADTEEKEKKNSLLKKIGKRIGERALDILTDGGDEINVAGFAINVRK